MVTGHEYVGTVEDVGNGVTGYRNGQLVSGEGHIVCGHCRNCRAGATSVPQHAGRRCPPTGRFAEYVSIRRITSCRSPTTFRIDIAAIFDPLGNAVHTALSFDLVGEDVLVTGAGPIGVMGAPSRVRRRAQGRHHRHQPDAPRTRAEARLHHIVDASKENLAT